MSYSIERVCKECGEVFIATNPAQKYCKKQHYRKCPICGKEYAVRRADLNDPVRACLGECSTKLRYRTNLEKYGTTDPGNRKEAIEKRRQTCLERYGVDNPAKCDDFVEKSIATSREKYGVDFHSQSDESKKQIKETWKNKSKEEREEIKQKHINTNRKKYGVDWAQQDPEIIERTKKTNLEKYGHTCNLWIPETREKIDRELVEKYGDKPFSSEEIKKKKKETNIEKYGVDHPMKSDLYKEKFKQTLIDRYGVDNPRKIPGVQEKINQTNMERYGSKTYLTCDEMLQKSIHDPKKYDEYLKFKEDPIKYIKNHFDEKPTVYQISPLLGVTETTIFSILDKFDARKEVLFSGSLIEKELIDFIHELNPQLKIIHNNKSVIRPYELDLYIPEFKFAIECNPTMTHNSSFIDIWGGEPKDYKYHQMKSKMCYDKDIFLFHIFGYEWTNKKDILKSMIANIIDCTEIKHYGRKTYIDEISHLESLKFLDENHRQGPISSKVRIGLRDKQTNELLSLMTFNLSRFTMGKTKESDKNTWELSRFCNKINTTTVGGASKLFNHFIKTYNPKEVFSFSDFAHTKGALYQNLGFNFKHLSDPSYVWVSMMNDSYFHRVKCQKKNLHNIFKGEEIDLSKTEKQILEEHGYAQVFDSGVVRWEWSKE